MGSLFRFNLERIRSVSSCENLVETGSGKGQSIGWALQNGLSVQSVEKTDSYYETCVKKFGHLENVKLHCSDSKSFLNANKFPENSIFYLDAHFPGGADFGKISYEESMTDNDCFPLIDELDIILEKGISNCIVIIDDARLYYNNHFQLGACPEFARRWSEFDALDKRLKRMACSHNVYLLPHDHGYVLCIPNNMPYDEKEWINILPHDSGRIPNGLPPRLGGTGVSIHRRVADSRFANRYFVGHGMDVGGGANSLALYKEFFPRITNVFVYEKEHGDAQSLSNVISESFDFLYSSHCLEHLRNPVVALGNWIRVVRKDGYLVVSVPDEDLYEQGIWPSRFNPDHKLTFTMLKDKSWSPVSVNVFELLAFFKKNIRIISVDTIDMGYKYTSLPRGVDQTTTGLTESAIEFILQRL